MALLKEWAAGASTPQLVAGDFNADMDQIDTTAGMAPNFVDSWPLVGSGPGLTAFVPGPTMKLDYWFSDASGAAYPDGRSAYGDWIHVRPLPGRRAGPESGSCDTLMNRDALRAVTSAGRVPDSSALLVLSPSAIPVQFRVRGQHALSSDFRQPETRQASPSTHDCTDMQARSGISFGRHSWTRQAHR